PAGARQAAACKTAVLEEAARKLPEIARMGTMNPLLPAMNEARSETRKAATSGTSPGRPVSSTPQLPLGFQRPSVAPVGSTIMLNQPAPGISVTSLITTAPSDLAFSVAAAISSTSTYASHADNAPGTGCCMIPPPVPSPTWIIV